MWVLTCRLQVGSVEEEEQSEHLLRPNKEYSIGRAQNCDLQLPGSEKSVGRNYGKLVTGPLEHPELQSGQLSTQPAYQLSVHIYRSAKNKDTNYAILKARGSTLTCESDKDYVLEHGDVIQPSRGQDNNWGIEWRPVTVFFKSISDQSLLTKLPTIGVRYTQDASLLELTTHYVSKKFTQNESVVEAALRQNHFVTEAWAKILYDKATNVPTDKKLSYLEQHIEEAWPDERQAFPTLSNNAPADAMTVWAVDKARAGMFADYVVVSLGVAPPGEDVVCQNIVRAGGGHYVKNAIVRNRHHDAMQVAGTIREQANDVNPTPQLKLLIIKPSEDSDFMSDPAFVNTLKSIGGSLSDNWITSQVLITWVRSARIDLGLCTNLADDNILVDESIPQSLEPSNSSLQSNPTPVPPTNPEFGSIDNRSVVKRAPPAKTVKQPESSQPAESSQSQPAAPEASQAGGSLAGAPKARHLLKRRTGVHANKKEDILESFFKPSESIPEPSMPHRSEPEAMQVDLQPSAEAGTSAASVVSSRTAGLKRRTGANAAKFDPFASPLTAVREDDSSQPNKRPRLDGESQLRAAVKTKDSETESCQTGPSTQTVKSKPDAKTAPTTAQKPTTTKAKRNLPSASSSSDSDSDTKHKGKKAKTNAKGKGRAKKSEDDPDAPKYLESKTRKADTQIAHTMTEDFNRLKILWPSRNEQPKDTLLRDPVSNRGIRIGFDDRGEADNQVDVEGEWDPDGGKSFFNVWRVSNEDLMKVRGPRVHPTVVQNGSKWEGLPNYKAFRPKNKFPAPKRERQNVALVLKDPIDYGLGLGDDSPVKPTKGKKKATLVEVDEDEDELASDVSTQKTRKTTQKTKAPAATAKSKGKSKAIVLDSDSDDKSEEVQSLPKTQTQKNGKKKPQLTYASSDDDDGRTFKGFGVKATQAKAKRK